MFTNKRVKKPVSFALRPIASGSEGPTKSTSEFTEIDYIHAFSHANCYSMIKPEDIPVGEGVFQIKWKGETQMDWVKADDVFAKGRPAIRHFFDNMNARRKVHYLKHLTHISSLCDIERGGISEETDNEYKLRIAVLSDAFLYELNHPVWGQRVTKLFEIVREDNVCYVWVNKLQVRSICENFVNTWEAKKQAVSLSA